MQCCSARSRDQKGTVDRSKHDHPRRYCGAVGRHREIGLSSSAHHWIVQVSLELQLLSGAMNLARRFRFRRFAFLRHISQPAHYNNGLGDTVQISAEIMPVRLR